MANKKASKKDLRQSAKRRLVNQSVRTSLKTYVKKVKAAAVAGDFEAGAKAAAIAMSALDKAAQRGIIHKNQAARRKSRAMRALNKAKASAS
ncbi:MAG: 30S ribosomal protein S20 [Fimbriimonadaceae bacterium]